MNELKVFSNQEFGQIRTSIIDGEPFFVAVDVCNCLETGNPTRALSRLDSDECGLIEVSHPQNENKTLKINAVNESGLYSLVLGSRKKTARQFKRWITHEVLPSIRKNGGYIANQENLSETELLAKALSVSHRILEEREQRIKELEPKAEYFDFFVDSSLLTNIRTAAKEFHMGQKTFIRFLLENKYVYRDSQNKLIPYNKHVVDGLFEIKDRYNKNSGWYGPQAFLTPKGKEALRLLLGK